jgi:hypothetical protein
VATKYSGAWLRQTSATLPHPFVVTPADADHGAATEHAALAPGGFANWQQDTLVPTLPVELMGDQLLMLPVPGTVARDWTPITHDGDNTGQGHGLDVLQAQDIRTQMTDEDLGGYSSRRYQNPGGQDGSYHAVTTYDNDNDGDSPDTPALRFNSGVSEPSDPFARTGKRIVRWRERVIDKHMWEDEYRASPVRNAWTPPNAAPQQNGNQYASPYPFYGYNGQYGIGSPDQFLTPVTRRSPQQWDVSMTTDGTEQQAQAQTGFGLTPWGL